MDWRVDVAKLGQLYLDGGRWNGEQLIPADWVAEASRKHVDNSDEFREAQSLMEKAQRIAVLGFGYHSVNMRRLKMPWLQVRAS